MPERCKYFSYFYLFIINIINTILGNEKDKKSEDKESKKSVTVSLKHQLFVDENQSNNKVIFKISLWN